MEHENLSFIKEVSKIIDDNTVQRIIIVNQQIYTKYQKDNIVSIAHNHKMLVIDETIAYGIKVIESCKELIDRQIKKIDNLESRLPLIVTNKDIYNFIYERELTGIQSTTNIIKKLFSLLSTKNNKKNIYFYISDVEKIDNDDIYISIETLQNICTTEEQISYELEEMLNINDEYISFAHIMPTYLDIMSSKIPFEVIREDSQVYIIKSKKYEFKVLFILNYKELENDNIDISKYEIIIETNDFSLYDKSVLKNKKINNIYMFLKDVGKCFNKWSWKYQRHYLRIWQDVKTFRVIMIYI